MAKDGLRAQHTRQPTNYFSSSPRLGQLTGWRSGGARAAGLETSESPEASHQSAPSGSTLAGPAHPVESGATV